MVNRFNRSVLLRIAACAAMLVLCAGLAGAASKKKRSSSGLPPQVALNNALLAKGDAVQDCAVKKGLDVKGGPKRVEISTKVTVSGRGQVIDVRTDVKVDAGDAKPVRECVDKLIRTIKFPPCEAPLVTIERSWTVAG